MNKQIPHTETHLPCWALDVTYHESITDEPKGQRCLFCAVFKLNNDRTLDVYYTMDDWFKRKPNVTFENIIELEAFING